MLPPPMTTATCTLPCSVRMAVTSRSSTAMRLRTSGSMPYPRVPASASPESFRTMRLYAGRPPAPSAATRSARLADLEAREALDHDALAGLGGGCGDEILDLGLPRRVLDERLLEQARLGKELLELAFDDLVEDLLRLLLVGHLLAVDLALLLEHVAGDVLARDVGGVARRHLHREVLHELLEGIGPRDEVTLAVDLDDHAELGAGVNVRADDPLLRLAMRL